MSNPLTPSPESDIIAATAATWLARRDRKLTAAEQDDYLQWLAADPRHAQAIARLEKAWGALDALAQWRPEHSTRPNPDLLASPHRRSKIYWLSTAVFAAAAALVLAAVTWWQPVSPPPSGLDSLRTIVADTYRKQTLPDGSVVELKAGSQLEIGFTTAIRRVRLVAGEVHFTVTKNPARPFVVHVGKLAVHAVGTAFNIRMQPDQIEVLVTEGKVRVDEPATPHRAILSTPLLVAGERAVISTVENEPAVLVAGMNARQIETELAWQPQRLAFVGMPLSEILADFNRHNSTQILLGDADLADLRIGGTFRADNPEAFVRLLETGFGIRVERNGEQTVLYRQP
ncbi:MAG: FecR domain-containing protein [Cephaloticoccus sp.]|nr:FecR domain-containing protein [Cephaloticoccus sp.]MCF7759337.1 FecR domain-containing protein [Cephaloticoccus sp.]